VQGVTIRYNDIGILLANLPWYERKSGMSNHAASRKQDTVLLDPPFLFLL